MNSLPRAGLRIGLSWASEPPSKVITSAPSTAIGMRCFILPATAWIKIAKPEQSESPEKSSYCGRSWLREKPSSRRPRRAARKPEGHSDHSPQRPFSGLRLISFFGGILSGICLCEDVRNAAAIESGRVTSAHSGCSGCLASTTFCAIIATGYSLDSSFRERRRDA